MLKKNSSKSIDSYPLIIMTTTNCPYCIKAKKLLKTNQIDYKEINYSPLMNKYFIKKYKDYPYVPRVISNKKFIGGYNELEIKIKKDQEKTTKKPIKEKITKKPIKEKITKKPIKEKITKKPIKEKITKKPIKEKITKKRKKYN